MAVIGRNFLDCRVFGGRGDDVFVWYLDEANPNVALLQNSFFGGGGWAPADWSDQGTDRLVLAIPPETPVSNSRDPITPGMLQVYIPADYNAEPVPDPPTEADVFARYVETAGLSPDGRHTMIFQYLSADSQVRTGFIFITAIEEIQVGIGPDAPVYRVDDRAGVTIRDGSLSPLERVPARAEYNAIMDDFVSR
jgi:hypothetical protein